jgi:hypothetical protein
MNYSYAAPAAANYARPLTSNISSPSSGIFSRLSVVLVVVFVVFVALVFYYKTVGYYMNVGWTRIMDLIRGGTDVNVEVGSHVEANLTPMDAPPQSGMGASEQRPSGMPGASDSGILNSLSVGGPKKEVFNVSRNVYTFGEASAVCSALGADLASYEQVKDAYEQGADWCNYGWIKGQMAVYPTQKETWDKLQKGAAEFRNACGRIGINGGRFDNPDLRFGVTCYGIKPAQSATDELLESQVALPQSPEEIEYEKKVQKFREQLATTTILPFKRGQWAE